MILVELAGAGGVGKSTLAPLLAQKLRDVLGPEAVAALPETGVARSQRRWTRIKRWAWTARHPKSLLVARKACGLERKVTRFSNWMRAFTTIGIGKHVTKKGVKVALVDQGMLRLAMYPEHAALLPKSLMPDLVLHLVAEPAVLELRRIYRSKKKHNQYQGESRITGAQQTIRSLGKLPEEQMREILVKFGEKFCAPAFSESEIEQLVRFSQELEVMPTAPATAARGRCDKEVCELFRQRGVLWQEIDNSDSNGPGKAIDACVQAILAHMDAAAKARGR